PPMRTRDGSPLRGGPQTMPGPDGTYLAYGRNWANVSNTPFREYKHWVHEGGVATPLIVHWPRGIEASGELRRQAGQLPDIMATCIEVSGADYPKRFSEYSVTPLAGVSLLPALAGRPLEREALYWEHEGNCAIRIGDWKLVRKSSDWSESGWLWELYHLAVDRSELDNLAEIHPERVAEMARKWEHWARNAKVVPSPRRELAGVSLHEVSRSAAP
ncbi:MAG: sulfatase/phosphatase domain-containing protein, partial [Planctomycetota bacterium]